jgi:hypothetical protein
MGLGLNLLLGSSRLLQGPESRMHPSLEGESMIEEK